MTTPVDNAEYISLESFKRDGNGVKTPVWVAPLDGGLVVFSESKAYKVKRIGRNARVRVARCNVAGGGLGEWYQGEARIVDDSAESRRGYDSLKKKYGYKMHTLNLFSWLGRKLDKRALIFIQLD